VRPADRVDNGAMPLDPAGRAADHTSTPTPEPSDALLARRAQILATEHWGLLAARGTAQSEVLTRITIFLTLVSAGLVTIGLLGQATDFTGWFAPASLSILGFLTVLGLLTQIRVYNVSDEDMMFVVAMNRLRGAYVELDPVVEEYFLEGTTDDLRGMHMTYSFLRRRSDASHVLGSSAFLITLVNACVLGLLVGGVCVTAGMAMPWAITVGAGAAFVLLAASMIEGYRGYSTVWRRYAPRRTRDSLPPHLERESRHHGAHAAT
jgi:ABC-type multidrug transport system fused ATPase/permease subunit